MSQSQNAKTKVPQGTEAAYQIITGRETNDIIALVFLPVGVLCVLYLLGILTLYGILGSVGTIAAVVYGLFYLVPENESILYWIKSWVAYKRNPQVILKKGTTPESIDDDFQVDTEKTGGRDISDNDPSDVISAETSTQELTRITTIDTHADTIELDDGSIVTGLRIRGMERNLTDREIKQKADESFSGFLQSTDYEISINCTSVQFPIESEVENFEKRLDHEEVKNRPIFKKNVKAKKKFVETRIKNLGMNNRQYYLIIKVSPSEQSIDEGGPFDLDFINPNSPIGKWIQKRKGGDTTKSTNENLKEMARSRMRSTKRSIGQIRQINATEAGGEELARVARSLYYGEKGNINGWEPASEVVTAKDQPNMGEA